jgi:hypothetical protein
MKVEIKEILEFKENADYKKLSVDEIVILEDYITNLQKENEELKVENEKLTQLWLSSQEKRRKAIKMFDNETLNKYYYGMSYEFEINDFKEGILNILGGDEE